MLIKITVVSSRVTAGLVAMVVGGTRKDRGAASTSTNNNSTPGVACPDWWDCLGATHAGRHGGWVEAMLAPNRRGPPVGRHNLFRPPCGQAGGLPGALGARGRAIRPKKR